MSPDLIFVIGVILAGVSAVNIMATFVGGETPRVAVLVLCVGGGLAYWASTMVPGGYAAGDIPGAIFRVLGSFFP